MDLLFVLATKTHKGSPGSGKSTLTQFLAGAVSDDYINPTAKSLGRRLVIPFILREFDVDKT